MEGGSEVSWGSFNKPMLMESELMAQLLGPYPFSSEQDQDLSLGTSSLFWPDSVVDSSYNSQEDNSSSCYWHPENCNGTVFSTSVSNSSFFAQASDCQTYDVGESNVVSTIEKNHEKMMFNASGSFWYHACLNEQTNSEEAGDSAIKSSEQVVILAEKQQHKRKFSMDGATELGESDGKIDVATKSPKKKVQEIAKNPKSKMSQKSNASCEDEGNSANAAPVVHSTSSCSSEDDSNASQEVNGGSTSPISKGTAALNLNGKARASRGSATDPQSLYARKRRERINERLRILQNLVPNGTKVDISTMLEEAVQYVKFLQLQIKLLSSDDLWMYAPLACNGMNIGLDLKISAQQQ